MTTHETGQRVRTTCPYCGVGCGVLAEARADGSVAVRGDPEHPANFGRLCSKGSALGETTGLEGRLLQPHVHGREATWDEALDLVASTFTRTIAEYGPEAVAFYVSGQLLTEDYYVANKLMKGFIGTANIDTNSRLCMASSVAGHRRAFGSDTVPQNYEDLELADLVVLVGSNLAWCHPVLFQRLVAAKEKRPEMRVVVVDPRRTMTADIADLHLAVRADGDVALFSGLLAWLAAQGAVDADFVANHTSGFGEALVTGFADPAAVAEATGLSAGEIEAFYRLFAETPRVVTLFSQGVNQSAEGTDKVNAIINCHLATGRIGKAGAGPFSITGQPNAMGGREVGGLANMLAAHMAIENPADRERVQRFWGSPTIAAKPGLKAVDLFRAVADGSVKALWIMATNPVDSMPDAAMVERALAACPFVVVSDVIAATDTLRHAHVALPAAAWGEKDGTVTNSERRISRQRPFLPLPGAARPDWRIICDVAGRMGFGPAFAYASPAEIFAEHAALSAFENDGGRDFDIGAASGLSADEYETLRPFQWPRRDAASPGAARVFGDGRFFTPDSRANFVPVEPRSVKVTRESPFVLNTGRVRDHWHTMTRTGSSPRLSQHLAEPFAEIHPSDATRLGIAEAEIVRIGSDSAEILVRALISERQQSGTVFVPMHWTDQFTANGRVDTLVPARTDPISGQPALKGASVRIERFPARAYGFAVLRHRPKQIDAAYWAVARCEGGWRCEFAFADEVADAAALAAALMGCGTEEVLAYRDGAAGRWRFVGFEADGLRGAVFLAPEPVAVSRSWAVEQLGATFATGRARLAVAAGRPGRGGGERGAIVCSCFGVGAVQIAEAARSGCDSVAAIGEALQAGTNCGSCRNEIKAIIAACQLQAAE